MFRNIRFVMATVVAVFTALSPVSAFQSTVHQFVPLPATDHQMVCFEAQKEGGALAHVGHAGMLPLGMRPYASPGFPPALWGAWFTWSHEGALLTYASGTLGSTAITDPASGAPLTSIRGATSVASALDVIVEAATGNIVAATLYSALYFWTPGHLYLLLVGGPPTVYEVTFAGAAIEGVRGVATLAAHIEDTDPAPTVMASLLLSGALVSTDSRLILVKTDGTLVVGEVTFAGRPLAGVRGILPMGGNASPAVLATNSYFWSQEHVYRFTTGPSTGVTELLTPTGAPISGTWGMARLTELWSGAGGFAGAAAIFTPDKQWFTNTIGAIPVQEVLDPLASSITSDVRVPRSIAPLVQAGNLSLTRASFGSRLVAHASGMVIAGGQ